MPIPTIKPRPHNTKSVALVSKDPQKVKQALLQLDRVAQLLDSQYRIPYTKINFGWDVIIGFVPVVGDLVAFGLASLLIFEARSFGAPKSVIMKMMGNLVIEFVAGSVPVLGDAFDVYWKANLRNIGLLRSFLGQQIRPEEKQPSDLPVRKSWYLAVLVGLLLASLAGWIYFL